MDTGLGRDGYSMIGQGRIAEIISAKSRERREIFEEAAGIAKYRFRREEAERKLEQAQENLLRLYDILSELEGAGRAAERTGRKGRAVPRLVGGEKEAGNQFVALTAAKTSGRPKRTGKPLPHRQRRGRAAEKRGRPAGTADPGGVRPDPDCLTKSEEYRQIRENLQNRIAAGKSEIAVHENERTHALLEQKRLRDELAGGEAAEKAGAAAIFEARKKLQTLREKLQELERQGTGGESPGRSERSPTPARAPGDEAAALQSQLAQCTLDISRFTIGHHRRLPQRSGRGGIARRPIKRHCGRRKGNSPPRPAPGRSLNGLLDEIRGKRETLQNTPLRLPVKAPVPAGSGRPRSTARCRTSSWRKRGKLQRGQPAAGPRKPYGGLQPLGQDGHGLETAGPDGTASTGRWRGSLRCRKTTPSPSRPPSARGSRTSSSENEGDRQSLHPAGSNGNGPGGPPSCR